MAFGEDHTVKRPVKVHVDSDRSFFALDLDVGDFCQVWLGQRPGTIGEILQIGGNVIE